MSMTTFPLVALATPAANCFIAAARGCESAKEWPSFACLASWAEARERPPSASVATTANAWPSRRWEERFMKRSSVGRKKGVQLLAGRQSIAVARKLHHPRADVIAARRSGRRAETFEQCGHDTDGEGVTGAHRVHDAI